MKLVALYTIHELVAHKLIHLCIIVLFGCFGCAFFLTSFTVGGHLKILLDFSLLSYFIFCISFPLVCVIPFASRHQNVLSYFLSKGIARHYLLYLIWAGFVGCMGIGSLLFYGSTVIILRYLTGLWILYLAPAFLPCLFKCSFLYHVLFFFHYCANKL